MADKFWIEKFDDKKVKPKKIERKKPEQKVKLNPENVRDGLAQLVLTIIELLREIMEKQAMRRMDKGKLTDEEIEKMGKTFRKLRGEVDKLKKHFGLKDEDLDLDLGPLGSLRGVQTPEDLTKQVSAVEIIDRLLGKGVFVKGDIVISVAEIDLLKLNLGILLASIDKALELQEATKHIYARRMEQLERQVKMLEEENRKLKAGS